MQTVNPPQMKTIKEAAKITNLAEHLIRQLVLQDKIVYIKAGKKYLINLEKLFDYLGTGESITKTIDNKYSIEKIEK